MEYQFESNGAILAFSLHNGQEVQYRDKYNRLYPCIVTKCCPKRVRIQFQYGVIVSNEYHYVKPENIVQVPVNVFREVRKAKHER